MQTSRFATWIAISGVIAIGVISQTSSAQDFPSRYITIINPYAAGGALDTALRPIADHMSSTLGQQVIIENVGGAGGTIGTAKVARAAPDGYTLLAQQVSLATIGALYPKFTFDVGNDFVGIGLINYNPSLIVGRPTLPVKTLPELVAWMRQQGRNATLGHVGPGSMAHLCDVMLANAVDAPVTLVPYRGGNALVADLVAGHVDLSCAAAGAVLPQVRAGALKAFASTSRDRYDAAPNLPTLVESGLKEMEISYWQGLFALAGTPKPVVDRLSAALRAALADPKVRKAFAEAGMKVYPDDEQTPDAATGLLRNEITRWSEVIRANQIRLWE